MTSSERRFLLARLEETRRKIEDLLPRIDPNKEIYPGWTIKDMLAHMTGWDDATLDSLRAHLSGRPPSVEAIRSIDEYNALTVSSRHDLNYEQVLSEWRSTRRVLRALLEEIPDDKFLQPLVVPWGEKTTITFLVEMFRDHEEKHAQDLLRWLENPAVPLEQTGN